MIGGFKVITLCGSTKFKNEFEEAYRKLSLEGNIVLTVCLFNHADKENISEETKEMFDMMHRRKIEMSDEIYVINKDNYVGESTAREIAHAKYLNKPVRYMYEMEASQ